MYSMFWPYESEKYNDVTVKVFSENNDSKLAVMRFQVDSEVYFFQIPIVFTYFDRGNCVCVSKTLNVLVP